MKIIRPNWVKHENKDKKGIPLSIFSIDVHPDDTRFATGGQGNDCGCVAIWNLKAVLEKGVENDENQPKLLCQIDSHLQCVNCVRWSNSGNYLASAGDDKMIMIWQLGGRYPDHTEQYRIVSTLRSHSGDILDLSWSHDDQYLASGSVDNMIIIWNTQRWPEVTKILHGHHGMVKGITWDPIGKYLASQSADKTLRVWRISDWSEEVVIDEPFGQCGGTTHVLRPSWSPDGQHLVSAQAMNNCGSVAKIINRQDWSFAQDFVGHRKAIPCARFNSNIFKLIVTKKKKNNDGNNNNHNNNNNNVENNQNASNTVKCKPQTICALGSRDRSISIWSTAQSRPLVVMDDVFENSVVDLSWTKCGLHLFACSVDGSIVCFEFLAKELGLAYNQEERMQFLQQLYGNSLFANRNSIGNRLIEDMDILMLQNRKSVNSDIGQNGLPNAVSAKQQSSNMVDKQNHHHCNKNGADYKANSDSTKPNPTTSINERKDSASTSSISNYDTVIKQEKTSSNLSTNTSPGRLAKGPTDKQIEIRSADGRRRIIPLFIPPTSGSAIDAADGSSNQSQPQQSSIVARPITFSSSSESKSKIVIETLDESNSEQNIQAYQYRNNSNSLPAINTSGTTSATPATASMATIVKSSADKPMIGSSSSSCMDNKTDCKNMDIDADKTKTNAVIEETINRNNASAMGKNNQTITNGKKSLSSEDESSDEEIIIKRSKKGKLINASQDQKRKPGRPVGSNTQPQQQQPQQLGKDLPSPAIQPPISAIPMIVNEQQNAAPQLDQISRAKILASTTSVATKTNLVDVRPQQTPAAAPVQSNVSIPKVVSLAANIKFPALRMPKQNHSSVRLCTRSEDGRTISASIEYPLASSGICKLTIFVDDQSSWNIMISNPIMALAANEEMISCHCDDNSIQVFHANNGRPLFVPIILDSPVARMICSNRSHLFLITCNAQIWLWDFSIPKVLIRGESLAPLLIDPKTSEQLSLHSASVSATSKPIVTISNGRTYVFEPEFQSWCLLNDQRDPLNSCTDLRPCAINSIKQLSSFSKIPSRQLLKFFSSNTPLAQESVVSFIEKQIEVSKLLGSADEYRFWVLNLVQNLVSIHSFGGPHAENIENRLKELCNNLLGSRFPPSRYSRKFDQENGIIAKNMTLESRMSVVSRPSKNPINNVSSNIVGLNKHDLLREVLTILTSNLSLQRLYLEFKELLNAYNDHTTVANMATVPKKTNIPVTALNTETNNNNNQKGDVEMESTKKTEPEKKIAIINNDQEEEVNLI